MQRALAPLQAEGWRLRHSLPWQGRGDIDSVAIAPDRDRRRDRDQDQDVRRAPSRSGARAGGVAVTAPAKVGTQRRAWRHVPRSCAGRRARRARRARGLDRPVDACPSRRGGDVFRVRLTSLEFPRNTRRLLVDLRPRFARSARPRGAPSYCGKAIASCEFARLYWPDPLVANPIARSKATDNTKGDRRTDESFPRIPGPAPAWEWGASREESESDAAGGGAAALDGDGRLRAVAGGSAGRRSSARDRFGGRPRTEHVGHPRSEQPTRYLAGLRITTGISRLVRCW